MISYYNIHLYYTPKNELAENLLQSCVFDLVQWQSHMQSGELPENPISDAA